MRFVFLLGGCFGFLVAGGVSFVADHSSGRVLLDAAIGSIAGGMLFRWFWSVLVKGMRETLLNNRKAASQPAVATTSNKVK